MCVYCEQNWTGIPSSLYSHIMPIVPAINLETTPTAVIAIYKQNDDKSAKEG